MKKNDFQFMVEFLQVKFQLIDIFIVIYFSFLLFKSQNWMVFLLFYGLSFVKNQNKIKVVYEFLLQSLSQAWQLLSTMEVINVFVPQACDWQSCKRHPSPIYSEMYGTGPWFFKKSKYGNLRFRQSGKMGLPCPCRIKPILSCRRRFCFGYIINLLLTHDGCLLAKFFYFAFFCTKNDVEVDKICKQNQTSVVNTRIIYNG